jgi:hypothetical protein
MRLSVKPPVSDFSQRSSDGQESLQMRFDYPFQFREA